MRREFVPPRKDWRQRLTDIDYHISNHPNGQPYWREDSAYILSNAEVEMFHAAAQSAQSMIDAALRDSFEARDLSWTGLDANATRLALASWDAREPSLYGRMDFAWDGQHDPILLEYNADTPTALYEAAVVQWRWLEDRDPAADQYNTIQERLIAAWPECADSDFIHFATLRDVEEELLTAEYLRECAVAAGVSAKPLDMEQLGWNGAQFVDQDDMTVTTLFKLYPTEWMSAEGFGKVLDAGRPRLIEPPWRLAASSKAMLAQLWRMFPQSRNLAPTFHKRPSQIDDFVAKPVFGREGAGVRFGANAPRTPAAFDAEPLIYQQRVHAKKFAGYTPVFGVWVIGGEPCGLGIREDTSEITGSNASFVPHRIE
jgi:glutathionylspermidine synthase